MNKTKLLVMTKNQNISNSKIDEILYQKSLDYRDAPYSKGEYNKSINKVGFYIFFQEDDDDDDYDSLKECNTELDQEGIDSFIISINQLSFFTNNLNFDVDDVNENNDDEQEDEAYDDDEQEGDQSEEEYDEENEEDESDTTYNKMDFKSMQDIIITWIHSSKTLFKNPDWLTISQSIDNYNKSGNHDIRQLHEISKQILLFLSYTSPNLKNENIISALNYIFELYNVINKETCILFFLIKYLIKSPFVLFSEVGEFLVYVAKNTIYINKDFKAFKSINGQKCNGVYTWYIEDEEGETIDFLFLFHELKLFEYCTNALENIFVPKDWDMTDFEQFLHFLNFKSEVSDNLISFKDYYKILGINCNASIDEIKNAYKNKINECHPDITKKANSNDMAVLVNEAYKILSDVRTRVKYDEKYKIANFL